MDKVYCLPVVNRGQESTGGGGSVCGRCFQPYTLTPFTNSQLHWTSDDSTLGRPSRLAFFHEEAAIRSKPSSTLVTDKTSVMPLSTNCRDHDVIHNGLLATQASRSSTFRVALETPSKSILLYKRRPCIKGLWNNQHPHHLDNRSRSYITTFSAEKVANMPFSTACHYHFSFDRSLTTLTPRAK